MAIRILPYKRGSRSAAALATAMGVRRVPLGRPSVVSSRSSDTIINWGNSGRRLPTGGLGGNDIINSLESVARAGNKLEAFRAMQEAGVRVPEFTTEQSVAQEWLDNGYTVVERHTLTGHSGEGIRLVGQAENHHPADLQAAPLYVKYVMKTHEYRVHVVHGTVTDVQRKARNTDIPVEQVNWQVRNHDNGFVFVRENVNPHSSALEQAIEAVEALGLDFGAVDIIWNVRQSAPYVLEVNTACGLEGTTLERYTAALTALCNGDPIPAWGASTRSDEVEEAVEAPTPPNWTQPYIGNTYTLQEDYADIPAGATVWAVGSSPNRRYLFIRNLASGTNVRSIEESEARTLLAPVTEETPASEPRLLVVGDIVKISRTGRYWHSQTPSNPRNVEGRVYRTQGNTVWVEWVNSIRNIYSQRDLILASVAENIEPSAPDVVQPTTGGSGRYVITVNNMVNIDNGFFETEELAQAAYQSSEFHNMRQLGWDVRIRELGHE